MKKLFTILTVILLITLAIGIIPASAVSYTGKVIQMPFNDSSMVQKMIVNEKEDTSIDYYFYKFGIGGSADLKTECIKFDETEKSMYFTPNYSGTPASTPYFFRLDILPKTADDAFNGSEYKYIKIRYKLVAKDDLANLFFRNTTYQNFDIANMPDLNKWTEKVLDLSDNATWGATPVADGKAFRLQLQYLDSNFSLYEQQDFRLYVQYIAFFENKTDADNYQLTSTSDQTTTAAVTTATNGTTNSSQTTAPKTSDTLGLATMSAMLLGAIIFVSKRRINLINGR